MTAAKGERDRRSYQPLVLLGVVAVTLPVTLRRTPEEYLGLGVAMMSLMALGAVAAWFVDARLGRRARRLFAWALVALGALALVVVASLAVPERPEHALPFAAGVAVTVAPVRRVALRLPVQVLVVVGMSVMLVATGRPLVEVVLTVALLVFVVWLSGVLAGSMLDARRAQQRARVAAERRATLLATVQELSGSSTGEAARTVVDGLRSLDFSVAGVSVVRDGMLMPLVLEGVPPAPPRRVGEGIAGTAVAEERTILSERYGDDPRRLPEREGLGSVIAVPVRLGGRVVGVVVAASEVAGPLPGDVVEVVEVLASHLGGVLETEERLDRQRELLERMRALEEMRGGLVTEVSEEVRDPLTVVRGIAETLSAHGDRLPADRRLQLLQGFEEQAGALRETIDALLDFSQLQASRPVAVPGLLTIGGLLVNVFGTDVVLDGELGTVVRTDAVLASRTLEIVHGLGPIRRVWVTAAETTAEVRLEADGPYSSPRARLLRGLAERLIVTAGGTWTIEEGAIVIGLPRDVGPEPEPAV